MRAPPIRRLENGSDLTGVALDPARERVSAWWDQRRSRNRRPPSAAAHRHPGRAVGRQLPSRRVTSTSTPSDPLPPYPGRRRQTWRSPHRPVSTPARTKCPRRPIRRCAESEQTPRERSARRTPATRTTPLTTGNSAAPSLTEREPTERRGRVHRAVPREPSGSGDDPSAARPGPVSQPDDAGEGHPRRGRPNRATDHEE